MVELAFSTNAYTGYSLPEAVRRIAGHGYAGVELLGDDPHAFFPDFEESDLAAVRDALEETGLAVSNVNANNASAYYDDAPPSAYFDPTLITEDDYDRTWRIEYTKDALDLAAAVGAPAACVATGRPLPGTLPEEARDRLHESLHELLDHAERRGVDLGIEFEPEMLIESTGEVLELIDEIGRDSLGVNLDLGHAAVYGEEPAESIRRCAGHITGVHLEDIVGGIRGKHYHRIPGEGDLEFAPVFEALDDVGYEGFVTMELYTYPDEPDRAAKEAYEAIAPHVA
jgi:sugar phosphate isomerase/epimerase